MRIGFFGGTFDPVHHGHLLLARDALEHARLDRIEFVPAAQAPLKKEGRPRASPKQRLSMLELAIEGQPDFTIATVEIDRGGVSYTVNTLESLRADHPGDELFWIIGGDQAAQLGNWQRIDRICEIATFLCLQRPGYEPRQPQGLPEHTYQWISARQIDLSSTEIRQRAIRGLPLDFFLPKAVAQYIDTQSLYRSEEPIHAAHPFDA